MINNLVIVESPAKAKTIEKFLGKDFKVKSSMGHIRDLAKEDLGIDIKNRRPSAKETFKWLDIDLLPHSSADTLLCEIYEWNTRNWRTTGENLIGEIFDVANCQN